MDVIGALDRNGGDLIFSVDDRPDVLFSGTLPEGNQRFIGFIDLVIPFTKLTFFSSDFVDDFAIDRVRFESATATPVPEPASLTLLAVGLLGGAARLRSRGAAPQKQDQKQDSVLAVAGVRPCEEKCPFPRVAGKRGRSLEF